MTNALTQTRMDVESTLVAAGLRAFRTTPDRITPPCVIVQSGNPYVEPGSTFTNTTIHLVLTLMVGQGTKEVVEDALDDLVCAALVALRDDRWSFTVEEPGTIAIGNAEYFAVNIQITNTITL